MQYIPFYFYYITWKAVHSRTTYSEVYELELFFLLNCKFFCEMECKSVFPCIVVTKRGEQNPAVTTPGGCLESPCVKWGQNRVLSWTQLDLNRNTRIHLWMVKTLRWTNAHVQKTWKRFFLNIQMYMLYLKERVFKLIVQFMCKIYLSFLFQPWLLISSYLTPPCMLWF